VNNSGSGEDEELEESVCVMTRLAMLNVQVERDDGTGRRVGGSHSNHASRRPLAIASATRPFYMDGWGKSQ